MKRGIQKILVMLLALSMVFTTMGLPAYADTTESGLADGTYNANGLSVAVLSMYHFHDAQVVVKGENAWLITTEDTDNTVTRFDGMAYGPQSQILDPADETNHTLVEGTVTATVVPIYNDDGTLQTRTFVLPVPKSVLEAGDDIYYMIKYTAGYSDKHDGDWYKASGGDYYLTGYTLEKVSDSTELPGEETPAEEDADYSAVDAAIAAIPADLSIYTDESVQALNAAVDAVVRGKKASEQAEVDAMAAAINNAVAALEEKTATVEEISLVPTNEELMFKVVNAYIEKTGDKTELVFALNANGYEDVISGTYDDAMAAQVGASHDNWIHGAKADVNCDYWTDRPIDDPPLNHYEDGVQNKWQFRVPVELPASGTVKVPVVVVSKSRYQSAEKANPENPDYSAAFTSRQFVIDLDEKTVRTGNLKDTFDVAVTSNVESFAVAETGNLYTVGTPKANEYICQPTITMNDGTYDMAFLGTKEEAAAEGADTIAIGEDKSFTLGFFNTLGGKQHIVDGKATAAFHVAADAPYAEKDTWVERTFTFDLENKTITVTGDELTVEEQFDEYIVGVRSIKTTDGTAYGMFTPNYDGVEGKALIKVAADGSATINYYNTRNTYPKIFLAELDADSLGKVATDEQLADPRCITAEVYAGNSSYREFTYSFDLSDLGKTVPFVTLNKSNTFNKTQTAFVFDASMTSKAAYDVIQMIDALPAAADVTVRDKDAIEAARAAYEALTDEQKAEVTNLNKLVAAEEAFAALPAKDEATIAVETAMGNLIQQYTDVNETTAAAVAAVRADYDALTTQQKAYIDDSALFKLHRAEACVAFVNEDGIKEGTVLDVAVDTSDDSPFIAATLDTRSNAAYIYLYSVADLYTDASKVSGTVSKSTHKIVGNNSILKGLWMVQSSEGQGREFVIKLTGPNGDSENITVKVPGVYGVMAEGTYDVAAIQTPSSNMRKYQRSTITSTVNAEEETEMTVEFVMPNTTYGKIYLGTKEDAAAATEGFIEPTGTEPTSGTTGEGNVYTIPLESMYMPITISYCNTSKNTWTQETVEFVVDEQTQSVIDAVAALGLNTYFNVTADQRELVDAADALYQALDENQKAIINNSNGGTLTRVVAMFKIADLVAPEIEALPAAENVTQDDVPAIRKVKADFDGMGQSDIVVAVITQGLQNTQIEKLISKDLRDKLAAAVAKADELDSATAEPVVALIEALPEAENATEADFEAILAAHNAYEGLTDSQKTFVTNYDKLAACEAKCPADYTAVDAAIAAVPAKLSVYKKATADAVTDAVAAVDRTKMLSEQKDVDAMAKAINDAVAALKVKAAQSITGPKATITKTYGNAAFNLNAKASGKGKLTYTTSKKAVATVSSTGKVTIKGAGTAKITIKAAATDNYKAATKTITVKVNKAANPVKVTKVTKTVKYSKVKNAKQTVKPLTVKSNQGTVTYSKASGSAKLTVNKSTGKVTVKKGTKKGTYTCKIKVKAAGNANYEAKTKTVTVTIKVK